VGICPGLLLIIKTMKKIAQGAEAKLYLTDSKIIKDRFEKDYRIKEIDKKLRKSRTKSEAKIFGKLADINFPSPKLINTDKKQKITMEYIKGPKVRDILEEKDYKKLSTEIGKKIAILHNNNIIHGDLTTSNMILSKEIYFIDFGLSYFSHKIEDRAVDLHLLKQALESKHYKIWEKCFKAAIKAYKKESKQAKEVLTRLETVEKRGRYKGKRK
jgi:Kae1-associated kinase Bud32